MDKISFAVFLSLMLVSFALRANGGTVDISGTITEQTCELADDSEVIPVNLGTGISRSTFTTAGSVSQAVPFVINLINCDAAKATVTFSGDHDDVNPQLLALSAGTGAASGIGVAILDKDQNLIPLDSPTTPYAIDKTQQVNTLQFYAQYMSTSTNVSPGVANATATFTLRYD